MKMTLAELRLVLENKEKELENLFYSRSSALFNVFKKTAEKTKELISQEPEFTVDQYTNKIEDLEKEIRIIRLLLATYNVNTLVDFTMDGNKITLQEAIYLVKQLRNNQPYEHKMATLQTKSRIVDPLAASKSTQTIDRSYEEITEPSFDVKLYRTLEKKTETLITKLEVAINQANYNTAIEVEGITLSE